MSKRFTMKGTKYKLSAMNKIYKKYYSKILTSICCQEQNSLMVTLRIYSLDHCVECYFHRSRKVSAILHNEDT